MLSYEGVRVHWLGHDSFLLEGSKSVVIDPFRLTQALRPDILLVTHEHFDHLSPDDIRKVVSGNTRVVAARVCEPELRRLRVPAEYMAPGSRLEVSGVKVEAVPAYNTNKFREPGKVFHPKGEGRVGYVVELDGVRVYHAGDTDAIPEMSGIKADVALLPVSGTYVMTPEEAAEAVQLIRPKVVVPMHYGSIAGSSADAVKFKKLVPTEVVILEKE